MRPGARVAAAIEILDPILHRHQPVSLELQSWGKAHRFAGSGDRNAIGHMVYDALRHKASSAHVLGSDAPRALVLGALRQRGLSVAEISAMCTGADHAPDALSDDEAARLDAFSLDGAPPHVAGDYPEWLHPSFERAFGDRAADEGRALARRAPADIRVNTLKATREKALKALADFGAVETKFSPVGIRVPAPVGDARTPNLEAEAAFQAGWCEIQDEGSQIVAALTGAGPRMQVLDLCAGAGGKTLALGAAMQNTGQIYAYDDDKHRLKPIFDRIRRAGVRNVQILKAGDEKALDQLAGKFDCVLVDAPCTGAGTWRRRPDAKWRLRPHALGERLKDQQAVLARAVQMVKRGGRLVYVTCSILPEENGDQIAACLAAHPDFRIVPYGDVWRATLGGEPPQSADGSAEHLVLTPLQHDTDGFFIAILERTS
ncbi:MAG: RsmB/NOP family class I SAM-dependent RNA methyltransferase [Hyphomicrobium sp.]|nr:RsmB/NOP family class I SAM-dependent RNA methyltransferase [Hyphomicrobium sp.]